ncbi:hypothetical protein HMPREF0262_03632 [Clostridium sp. ATCC 29733]|nr:hypothetical protein HMPREF0262_03632 [Clostridium sp. ATCC 29733]
MKNMIIQNVSLSDNLKRLRKRANLSQEKLVGKMNLLGSRLDRSAYSKIEIGILQWRTSKCFLQPLFFGAICPLCIAGNIIYNA